MSEDTRKVGCVPSPITVNSRVCGLWSLTADKMIKRQDQVKSQMIIPTGSPPTTPFTFPCFSKMDYSPLQRHGPHFFASTSLLLWFPFLKNSLNCRNAIISQSNINTFSFKSASLVFPLKQSLWLFLTCWASFIQKTFFKYLLWPWNYPTYWENSLDSLEIV